MRRIGDEVAVQEKKGWPAEIHWHKKTYRTQKLVDFWVVRSRWWAREEKRIYFRVSTDRGALELFCSGKQWVLSKIFD